MKSFKKYLSNLSMIALMLIVLMLNPATPETKAFATETASDEQLQSEQIEQMEADAGGYSDEHLQIEQMEADAGGYSDEQLQGEQIDMDTNGYTDDDAVIAALEVAFHNVTEQWELYGYPDDIGGIYYDSDFGTMGILIVNPTPERMNELRAMFSDQVIFTPCMFSYNELRLAQKEIDTIMGSDSGIYSSGVGWTSTDGRVHGFGESGKEFRLVVGVDESVFEYYREGFANLYGERVVVQISDPLVPELTHEDDIRMSDIEGTNASNKIVPVNIDIALAGSAFSKTPNNTPGSAVWLWAILGVCLLALLLLLYRIRSYKAPAAQTADGEIVVNGSTVSKKQVINTVKNSTSTPSDHLFDSIIKRIESQQGKP